MRRLWDMLGWWRTKPMRPNGHGDGNGHRTLYTPTAAPATEPFLSHYERLGIPRHLHYPSTTLGRLLDQSAERFGEAPALAYGDVRWTYAELRRRTNRLAGGLASMGVRRGDRVVITLPNCPEFVTAFLAVQKLAAIVVNAGPLMGADDLSHLIDMTKPRLVIALDLQGPTLHRACRHHENLPCLGVSLSAYQPTIKRMGYRMMLWKSQRHADESAVCTTMDDLLEKAPSRPPTVAPHPDDIAVLQPTGGTTGKLKVARLTHRNLIANAAQMSVWVRLRPAQERVLGILPMFHVYGLSTCLTTAIYNSAMMIPLTRFRVEQVIDAIVEHRPTVIPLAPVIVEAMCDELEARPNAEACEVIRRATVMSGAAPLLPTTSRRFERITGLRILQGYGLTEASPVTHANPSDAVREGSIGIPLPDTTARVVDLADNSRDAAPGEPGELWVTGPQVMQGYLDNPDENERMLHTDRQGQRWLRTGDVVCLDDDGYFAVVDRQKDMINRGGLKVWPAKVEQVIVRHPQVKDVAVIGRADPVHTECVVAIVRPDPSVSDTDRLGRELELLCREHLAPYEVPKVFEFVNELPRTALGKMQKHKLTVVDSHSSDDRHPYETRDAAAPAPQPAAKEAPHGRPNQ
jgi:long-chain acyl-CoA synthetase